MSTIQSAPIYDFRDAISREQAFHWREHIRQKGQKLVFTNGVFDILHSGHTTYLEAARNMGDAMIIGCNTDASVKRLKGESRPIQSEEDRAKVLAALRCTDAVIFFDEDTPLEVITFLQPDILIKGADYAIENIAGADVVIASGGKVLTIDLVEGRSTSNVIERILSTK
jgi:rfaE bifunctional protein nucleotidyltransferase chain/domain